MKVAFITAEMAPFAKEGGLADVAGALPKELAPLLDSISVFMPLYGHIDRDALGISKVTEFSDLSLNIQGEQEKFDLFRCEIDSGSVQINFIANNKYFGRNGVYCDPGSGAGFEDNNFRFLFFQRAVLHLLKSFPQLPDLIHCNDHQTALIPFYLKNHASKLHGCPSLLSIHNLAYQGLANPDILPFAGIDKSCFYPLSDLEFYGQFNPLKAGIINADKITTVSPTYAREIQEPEYGAGLEGVLRQRQKDLHGILNGVDYQIWNPETDLLIPHNYSANNLQGKSLNKQYLQKKFALNHADSQVPLMGIISRLVDQKGFDILLPAIESILREGSQIIILGSGEKSYRQALEALQQKNKGKMVFVHGYNNNLAHLIEAACDIYLMPSLYEPCGLNQLFSLRYGTIPVVRKTGGLADTVIDHHAFPDKSNGFHFSSYSTAELKSAISRAVDVYKNKAKWHKIVRRAMKADFSWPSSANIYYDLYNQIVKY